MIVSLMPPPSPLPGQALVVPSSPSLKLWGLPATDASGGQHPSVSLLYHLFLPSLPQVLIPRLLCLLGVKHFPWEVDRKVGNQLSVGGNLGSLWEGAPWPSELLGNWVCSAQELHKGEITTTHPTENGRC